MKGFRYGEKMLAVMLAGTMTLGMFAGCGNEK